MATYKKRCHEIFMELPIDHEQHLAKFNTSFRQIISDKKYKMTKMKHSQKATNVLTREDLFEKPEFQKTSSKQFRLISPKKKLLVKSSRRKLLETQDVPIVNDFAIFLDEKRKKRLDRAKKMKLAEAKVKMDMKGSKSVYSTKHNSVKDILNKAANPSLKLKMMMQYGKDFTSYLLEDEVNSAGVKTKMKKLKKAKKSEPETVNIHMRYD